MKFLSKYIFTPINKSIALLPALMVIASSARAESLRTTVFSEFDDAGFEAGFDILGPSLAETVGGYINSMLGLLGVVLVVLIIYAGFLWMTAGGSEEKIKKAKGILSNSIIGIVIILAAYSITEFVLIAVLPS